MPELIKVFAALGDSTRFSIVEKLIAEGALPAGHLQDVADISAPAISRHLKVLREAGVVTQTIDRQRRIYEVDPAVMQAIDLWLDDRKVFWDAASVDR